MNRLAAETSPYLLQHADNPVDWYPWGQEALARARAEDKPIFLSIGYSACHWCHVMEHESFAVPATAAVMNEYFISIKVDREERPDLDALYMDAAIALIRSGGWPLNLALTPDGKPFWAATYLPPVRRHGLRSFPEMLEMLAAAWRGQREQIEETGLALVEHLRTSAHLVPAAGGIDGELVRLALEELTLGFDWSHGGWGGAPKFPAAPVLEFLLRREEGAAMAERTLTAMAAGGMYDLVGGGFHRYSVDEQWLVPHFEKMLPDNAELALCYLHGFLALGEERYLRVAETTIEYMLRELKLPDGGFASSQDADTDGREGATYTWRRGEVPDPLLQHFEGDRFIVRGELGEELRLWLLEQRLARRQPARDDKVVSSWNGLTLATLAEGARLLGRDDWLKVAQALGEFLLGPLSSPDGRLHRTWRVGTARGVGYLDDYAEVANGLLELHAASGELRWLEEANRLARLAVELFSDGEAGGFFQTPVDAEELVVRRKSFDDHPAPSGNSMLAYVLLRLSRIYGDDALEQQALSVFPFLAAPLLRAPTAFGFGLVAIDFALAPSRELAIAGGPDTPVARAALGRFEPRTVIAFGPADGIPLLEGKTLVDGAPAVYRCEHFACQTPVTDARDL